MTQAGVRHSLRPAAAAAAGLAVTLGANLAGTVWAKPVIFNSDAIYDSWIALATLFLPALIGGVVVAVIAREAAVPASVAAYGLFAVLGLIHPFWHIPRVSHQSARSLGMHYLLYSPLAPLPFGMLAAWFVGQFVTGKWHLDDDKPVAPGGGDD